MDNNNFGMRSIASIGQENPAKLYGEIVSKAFSHDWIFGSIWEKFIIFGSFAWTLFSIVKFLWGLFR